MNFMLKIFVIKLYLHLTPVTVGIGATYSPDYNNFYAVRLCAN